MSVLAAATVAHLAGAMAVVRLSLHVLAATVWVGGQLVLGGLMGSVRKISDDAPRTLAKAFGRLSWPAFWLLILTGLWNYAAVNGAQTSAWRLAFAVKMIAVVVAGITAFLHTRATSASRRGMFAGLSALASIAALVLGVALGG